MNALPSIEVANKKGPAQRMPALDALRGLAVALVLVYHLHEYVPLLWSGESAFKVQGTIANAMRFLWIGVDLFYVLSGFFIGMAVLRPAEWRPVTFIKSRLTRILPAYYVSLALVVALLEPTLTTELKGWTNIGMHIFMLHSLQQWTMFSINGPYWTLGVEFGFYIVMLALAPVLRLPRGWAALVMLLAICYLWRANLLVGVFPAQRFFWGVQIFGMLDEFALGIGLAMIHQRGLLGRLLAKPIVSGTFLFLAGCVLVTACLWHYVKLNTDYWSDPLTVLFSRTILSLGFSLWIVAFLTLSNENWFRLLTQATGMVWIGKLSFSIYLYHIPIILLMHRYIGNWTPGLSWIAAVVTATLLVSFASHRWVEQRWHRSA